MPSAPPPHCSRPTPPPPPQAYVTGVNKALEQYAEAEHKGDVPKMISLQPAIKFNGGGAVRGGGRGRWAGTCG